MNIYLGKVQANIIKHFTGGFCPSYNYKTTNPYYDELLKQNVIFRDEVKTLKGKNKLLLTKSSSIGDNFYKQSKQTKDIEFSLFFSISPTVSINALMNKENVKHLGIQPPTHKTVRKYNFSTYEVLKTN